MEYTQIAFTIVFVLIVIFNIYKGARKNKSKPTSKYSSSKSSAATKTSSKRKTIMDEHADWDEAAWGGHKSSGSASSGSQVSPWDKAAAGQSGHKIPTWDKPKRDKPPSRAEAPKWDKPMERPNPTPSFGSSFDRQESGYSTTLYLLLLTLLANLVALIYVGFGEFEAAQSQTSEGLKPGVGSVDAYAWLLNVEMALMIVFILGLIYAVFQWFEKSSGFSRTFLLLFASMAIFIIADALAYNYFFPIPNFIDSFLPERDVLIAISTAVFWPYVKFSKHVKAVFRDR